ncbi:MAG: class III poly(R)-hydroxyalkanoic acid synthase subunit PhaC [Anaerolineae bacterium]|nr:class III poly(R)-hydroxyalkanoic acid synthase subunit PhaC [Anaerolineae bacterium]
MDEFPFLLRPDAILRELTALQRRTVEGVRRLGAIRDEQLCMGTTPKTAVFQTDKVILYRYAPMVEQPFPIPLLIVYSLVNRPTLVDLYHTRSLALNLIQHGIDVYLIDWGYPTRADRWLALDDYINDYVDACVDFIREAHQLEQVNLLGICQGGVFALCYAALHPARVKNLIAMVTPVDFHAGDAVIARWAGQADDRPCVDVDQVVAALGNIPGDVLNLGFLMREPFGLNFGKYFGLLDLFDDERRLLDFLRVERWSFDSPDQAGEAFREFVKYCYQENRLVQGTLEIGGRRIDLRQITMPVLNLHADYDDLVPPPSVEPLGDLVGTADYTRRSFPVGHIGMYISRKVQQTLPALIAEWLKARGD